MKDRSDEPKRNLGANLEHAEEFIADAVKAFTSDKIQELANHNSETSNALYQKFLSKYPNSFVNERDVMLRENRFKYVAAEYAGGERFSD